MFIAIFLAFKGKKFNITATLSAFDCNEGRSAYRRDKLPNIPRTSARPSDDATDRATDFIAASATVWRPEPRGAGTPGLAGPPVPKSGKVQPPVEGF